MKSLNFSELFQNKSNQTRMLSQFCRSNSNNETNMIDFFKKGYKIRIKKQNRGKFTEYCGGKVTEECIRRGKNSSNPKIRKRATFAANARKWKH